MTDSTTNRGSMRLESELAAICQGVLQLVDTPSVLLGPALVALLSQLVSLIGKGAWAHALLPGSAFDGWHGLFSSQPFYGQLIVSVAVSLVWTVVALAAAWVIVSNRDFSGPPVPRAVGLDRGLPGRRDTCRPGLSDKPDHTGPRHLPAGQRR